MKKRILAFLLATIVYLSLFQISAMAAGETVTGTYDDGAKIATISLADFSDGYYVVFVKDTVTGQSTDKGIDIKQTSLAELTMQITLGSDLSIYEILVYQNGNSHTATGYFQYTVSFDSNQGSLVPQTQIVAANGLATDPGPSTRAGYVFNGWFNNGAIWDFATPVTQNLILKADWTADPRVTVSFDTRGGTPVPPAQVIQKGAVAVVPATNPALTGYNFLGWFENDLTATPWNFGTPINADMVIYARWQLINNNNNNNNNSGYNPIGGGTGGGYYSGTGGGLNVNTSSSSSGDGTQVIDPVQSPLGSPFRFIDVYESDWFYDNVYFVFDRNLFKGTSETEFSPQMNMTRAMFVTVLGRTAENMGINTNGFPRASFRDVEDGMWYTKYVDWAVANGITSGLTQNTFGVNNNVTREQMAVMFVKFAEHYGVQLDQGESKEFADRNSISSWANEGVSKASAAGLISGYPDGTFRPQGTATRAEVATVFTTFTKKYVDLN